MELLDSRRLTGPNLLWERLGAVLDVRFGDRDPAYVVEVWEQQLRRMLEIVGWAHEQTRVRHFRDGASLAFSAPVDALYAATDINDWAWEATMMVVDGRPSPPLEPDATRLRQAIQDESNPRLRAIMEMAAARGLPALRDDDYLTVGLGNGGRTWDVDHLPGPEDLNLDALHGVPVGLVTGTNGKTTSVRLAVCVARSAGLSAGFSSTDWVGVNDDVLERGDYSGPGGARQVLRDPRVEMAILETARGGLLRRGLALGQANAALITNVAADHLGEFGVEDLEALADVKWTVTRALSEGGRLILNAEDPLLVARGQKSDLAITWFSPDPGRASPTAGSAAGDHVCTVEEGMIVLRSAEMREPVVAVNEVPITLEGRARHQVQNVLGVTALMQALGVSAHHIAAGLRSFRAQDNPGRCNIFDIDGVQVIVDFAHNPHGLEALIDFCRTLPARRRLLATGQAGDRCDADIRQLARAANGLLFERIIIKCMSKYNRGRANGEVARIMIDEFLSLGVPRDRLEIREGELDTVKAALQWAESGDLLVLPVHSDRDQVLEFLRARAGAAATRA